ncbi:hypothetical protein EWM64_g1713 [Hericium alpestre]|uniref:YEATS domain-containing protein n=1 Tax=Hericium alpestre TaxID=135208 RepID=A0A4Z0A9S7_9AGAM|nr:hypothetical protein EWM64_g1713 [Hericium alpestre]
MADEGLQQDLHPRKRRRMSHDEDSDLEYTPESYRGASARQLLLDELELETSIRQRLYDTIQSRLTWALILQESLQSDHHRPPIEQRCGSTEFQTAALEALDVLEAPCRPFFDRELRIPSGPIARDIPFVPPVTHPATATFINKPDTRRSRQRPLLGLGRAPVKKLLFLRNSSIAPGALAKLQCLDCHRSDFPTVQGLLNHCRLGHQRDLGSHDECIQQCAVLVPEEEREYVLENGTELSEGNLPSLRRLFEIAVGGGQVPRTVVPVPPSSEEAAAQQQPREPTQPTEQASTLLTRTLGHHIDTPALAPFLGRTPKRRCIKVYAEDEPVDILGGAVPAHQTQKERGKHWRMAYHHRSRARPALDLTGRPDEDGAQALAGMNTEAGIPRTPMPLDAAGSRFHILARVSITDRSLWLPTDRRPATHPEHTHRWILSVDSPSYSLHITAFLTKMTVTCLTDPPPSSFTEPIVITASPFATARTTDRPFLARVTLTWAGAHNPAMEIDHWIELDALKAANPVVGEEQVLDVELDRATELHPMRLEANRLDASLWERKVDSKKSSAPRESAVAGQDPDDMIEDPSHVAILKSLVSRFPLTQRDVKGRNAPQVPYKLISSPTHFRNLVVGRRKAIEWARAQALKQSYEEHVRQSSSPAYVHLSTADVFRWLEDEGLYLRPAPPQPALEDPSTGNVEKAVASPEAKPDSFCAACGLNLIVHPQYGPPDPAMGQHHAVCPLWPGPAPKLPLLDVRDLLLADSDTGNTPAGIALQFSEHRRAATFCGTERDLLTSVDPAQFWSRRQIGWAAVAHEHGCACVLCAHVAADLARGAVLLADALGALLRAAADDRRLVVDLADDEHG